MYLNYAISFFITFWIQKDMSCVMINFQLLMYYLCYFNCIIAITNKSRDHKIEALSMNFFDIVWGLFVQTSRP